ncbi:phosphopantetheine-binding protein [Streptomyces sp. NPDC017979]|uniref:phosphopantetheine-binding protein n=1 Tax=Streptomyces sp. NPDC017979 TaxID=3365024 RepID=UPI00378C0A06
MTSAEQRDALEQEIRGLIARAVGVDRVRIDPLPADTPLFGPEVGLTSLAGMTLLALILDRYGVDVALEDLNLDALESIARLRDFVADYR